MMTSSTIFSLDELNTLLSVKIPAKFLFCWYYLKKLSQDVFQVIRFC